MTKRNNIKNIEKKETVVWELIPNQYEWNILLCLSKESYLDLINMFNEKYDLDFDQNLIAFPDINPVTLFNFDKRKAIIVLREYNQQCSDYSTLAHEITHIITAIGQALNIPIDFDNTTEVWAYFMSFYMDICIQSLNEHINSKKKKTTKNKS